MRKSNVLNSPRLQELKKKRRRIFLGKILFFVFGLLVLLTGLTLLTRIDRLNIAEIKITGNKIADSGELEAVVRYGLAGEYLWLFPKTNFLFYPKNEIKNELYTEFKRLKDIEIAVGTGRVLGVSVTERVGAYMWCGEVPPLRDTSDQQCYFMDEDGYIFEEAPYFSGEVYFKFYGGGFEGDPSGNYFFQQYFNKLVSLKKSLETMGLKSAGLHIVEGGDIKVFLAEENSSSKNPEIILKTNSDLGVVVDNLETALTTEPLQTDFKKKYRSLQYIDLRFGNKVYWKFQ